MKQKYRQMKKFLALSLSDVVFIMLINVKMSTIVGILTFMSRINFVLSSVEHRKSFITSVPGQAGEGQLKHPIVCSRQLKNRILSES